jgi:hypothetical protein
MQRAHGYVTIVDPGAPLVEYDTVVCCHCNKIVFTKPGSISTVYLIQHLTPEGLIYWSEAPGAACWHCHKPVCLPCHALGCCLPLERWLDRQERTG